MKTKLRLFEKAVGSADDWPLFLDLVENKRFSKIVRILDQGDHACVRRWLMIDPALGEMSNEQLPLHAVLQYRPPVELCIKLIARLRGGKHGVVQRPEESIDARTGKSPLHVAAASNCSSDIIDILTYRRRGKKSCLLFSAVSSKDHWGRSPLHWACTSCPRPETIACFRGQSEEADEENAEESVAILLQAYPEAANEKDLYGMTPMDLALKSNANEQVLLLLREHHKQTIKSVMESDIRLW